MFRKTFDFFQTALQKEIAQSVCQPLITKRRLFAATAGRRLPFLRCAPLLCKCKHGMKRQDGRRTRVVGKVFFYVS